MPNKWYQPSTAKDAVDTINSLSHILAFIQDALSQTTTREFDLTEDGATGLYNILSYTRGTMDMCADLIATELYKNQKEVGR